MQDKQSVSFRKHLFWDGFQDIAVIFLKRTDLWDIMIHPPVAPQDWFELLARKFLPTFTKMLAISLSINRFPKIRILDEAEITYHTFPSRKQCWRQLKPVLRRHRWVDHYIYKIRPFKKNQTYIFGLILQKEKRSFLPAADISPDGSDSLMVKSAGTVS